MQGEFLTRVLGLQGLYVTEAKVEGQWIDLDLERDDGGEYICGECGQGHFVYHDRYRIHPRDLPISGRHVRLHLWRYRAHCGCCGGVVNEHLPYARPHGQMTIRLEEALHAECAETAVKAVAERYELSWGTVRDVDLRRLREEVAGQSLDWLRWIAVDEIAHAKGHKYLTVVTDLERRRVVRLSEDRKAQSLSAFFRELGRERCARITRVVIDMWKPYRRAIRLPQQRILLVEDLSNGWTYLTTES